MFFSQVYFIGQRSRANTDKLEKHPESADLHQKAYPPACCDIRSNQ